MTLPSLPSLPGLSWSRHKKPGFSTRVASHVSGREVRLALMSYPLYEFEAVYGGLASSATPAFANLGASSLQSLMGFFLLSLGQAGVFLYTDPDDNTVSGQNIGVGDGATQRFIVSRTLGGFSEPASYVTAVSNVYLNGVDQGAAGVNWQFTAPNLLGFATPPGNAVAITATFAFAFQCRFLDDQLDFEEFMSALWKLDKLSFRSIKPNTSAAAAVVPSWYTPYAIGGANPYGFADFSTEGGVNHYLWNGATCALGAAWLAGAGGSYTNATGKWLTNASGLLAFIAANTLPFDYSPTSVGTCLGLSLEAGASNLVKSSGDIRTSGEGNSVSAWTPQGTSATLAAGGTAPDGVSAATILSPLAGTGDHERYQTGSTLTGYYTFSCYAKAGTASWLCMDDNTLAAYFNLSAGTIGTVNSNYTAAIQNVGNGWYRCSITRNYTGQATNPALLPCTANGQNYNWNAAGTETIYVWGYQFEAGGFVSSYIPTTTASASRAADSLYLPWTATTFTARVKATMAAEADNGRLLGAGSGGLLYEASGPNATTNNGTSTLSTAVNAWTAQNIVVLGGSASGRVISANGNAAASDSYALVPSAPSDIYLGEDSGGSNPGAGHYAQFGLWTVAATAGQAVALSATG